LKASHPLKIVAPTSSPRADNALPCGDARRRPRHSSPLAISAKPWDARILKLNGLVKRYSQIKRIFSIEVAKDKSLISFNRNSHAKMAPDSEFSCFFRTSIDFTGKPVGF
jgi:hypothetical protein